jgi:hypothetical protein
MKLERNDSLRSRGVNEHGDPVVIRKRFWHHPDCKNAYRNYFCWINFPRCQESREETLATCRSACENYFISCGLDRDIWRCGPSQFFNGYKPEEPAGGGFGEVYYMRDYFPGQPFRENKFGLEGFQKKICTPSIDGSASRVGGIVASMTTVAVAVTLAAVLWV